MLWVYFHLKSPSFTSLPPFLLLYGRRLKPCTPLWLFRTITLKREKEKESFLSVFLSFLEFMKCKLLHSRLSAFLCISVYLSFCFSVFLFFCLSVFLSFCLSVFLSFYLSVFLSFCLSVLLSFCLSIFLSFLLSFYLSVFPSVFLSFCLSFCLFCIPFIPVFLLPSQISRFIFTRKIKLFWEEIFTLKLFWSFAL